LASELSKPVTRVKRVPTLKRIAFSAVENNQQKSKDLENTQLATPSTIRSIDIFSSYVKPKTPKSCVQVAARAPITPNTPRTPRTGSVYNRARQLFARSPSNQLIGREKERCQLDQFLREGIDSQSGRCLYVSGPPGTGKSAFVSESCQQYSEDDRVCLAYLNCMSVKNAQDVYERLADDICGLGTSRQEAVTALKTKFFPKGKQAKTYVVTLDEIDHLLQFDLSCLYTIFEWALNPKSRLLLIGIANALDFTDRFLPRLKARSMKPELLPFTPYSVDEINSVITSKLRSLLPPGSGQNKHIPLLRPEGIKLLARKVTAQTGDLRKAFDIVRGTLDLIETKTKASLTPVASPDSTPLSENNNLSTPPKSNVPAVTSIEQLTAETAPCATIADVARVAAAVFNNGTSSRLKSLTLQQKAALCSLVSLEKQTLARLKELALSTPSKSTFAKSTGVEVRKLFDMYKDLCTKEGALTVLTRTEFGEVIDGLMEASLVREAGKGYGMKGKSRNVIVGINIEKRVESAVTEKELQACLEGVGGEVLKSLLIHE
jgi:cell division control protein 6